MAHSTGGGVGECAQYLFADLPGSLNIRMSRRCSIAELPLQNIECARTNDVAKRVPRRRERTEDANTTSGMRAGPKAGATPVNRGPQSVPDLTRLTRIPSFLNWIATRCLPCAI